MPATTGKKELSNRDKAIGGAAVIFVLLAVVAIYIAWKSQQVQVVKDLHLPAGWAAKSQAMKAMKSGQSPGNMGTMGAPAQNNTPQSGSGGQ